MQSNSGSDPNSSNQNNSANNAANAPVNRNMASRPRGSGPRQGAP